MSYLAQQHEGEHDVSLVLAEGGVFAGQPEVRSAVYGYDAPEVVYSHGQTYHEGAQQAQQASQSQVLKHYPN